MTAAPHPFFCKPCTFVAGAATVDSLPAISVPEVALIGRSNVGKSSLLNALVGQKSLARTSQNPGATKQLNFFLLAERLMLVDLPGYGFAKISKATRGDWDDLIRSYLCGRPTLKRILMLIDARRGILPVDEAFMSLLDDAAVTFQVILTKIDTLTPKEIATQEAAVLPILRKHVAAHPQAITTSALTKQGIRNLQEEILPFAAG